MRERLKYQRKCYTIADYYISYKEYIEPNTQYDVDLKTFKAIVTDYFKYIKNEKKNYQLSENARICGSRL